MKTKEKRVAVEFTDNGRLRRCHFLIADDDGNLMTNRLRRLLAGKLGRGSFEDEHDIHFVGMAWERPYTILQELVAERQLMKDELLRLGDHGVLAYAMPRAIPEKASNETISTLVLKELKFHKMMKSRIRQLKK